MESTRQTQYLRIPVVYRHYVDDRSHYDDVLLVYTTPLLNSWNILNSDKKKRKNIVVTLMQKNC